jgi:hypothetical protein
MPAERKHTVKTEPRNDPRNRIISNAPGRENKSQPSGPTKKIIRVARGSEPSPTIVANVERMQGNTTPHAAHASAAIQEKTLCFIKYGVA